MMLPAAWAKVSLPPQRTLSLMGFIPFLPVPVLLAPPFHCDSSLTSSACSFTLPCYPCGALPGCLLSLIRQMQSVGRPSPLAAKQPPLISARVYRIST